MGKKMRNIACTVCFAAFIIALGAACFLREPVQILVSERRKATQMPEFSVEAVMDKSLFDDTGNPTWTPFERDVTNLYISDKILSDMRKIEARFDTEVGIPNNENEDKKERLIVDEVSANNAETTSRAEMWLDELKKGCSAVEKMFGVSVSVDWRINPNIQGGVENGVSDGNGAV